MDVIGFFSYILKQNKAFDQTQINRYIAYFLEQTKFADYELNLFLKNDYYFFEEYIAFLRKQENTTSEYETDPYFGFETMESNTEYEESGKIISTKVSTMDYTTKQFKRTLFQMEGLEINAIKNNNKNLFYKGVAICLDNNGQYGLVNKFGEIIRTPYYDLIETTPFGKCLIVSKSDKYGVINFEGEEVVPLIYDLILSEADDKMAHSTIQQYGYAFNYLILNQAGKMGLMNKNLEVVLPCQYPIIYSLQTNFSKANLKTYFIFKNDKAKYNFYHPQEKHIEHTDWDEVFAARFCKNIPFKRGQQLGFYQWENGKEFLLDFEFDLDAFEDSSQSYIQIKNRQKDKYAIFDLNFKQLTDFVFDIPVDLRDRYSVYIFGNSNAYFAPISKMNYGDFFRKFGID